MFSIVWAVVATFMWVISTAFGIDVVPEVNTSVYMSSGFDKSTNTGISASKSIIDVKVPFSSGRMTLAEVNLASNFCVNHSGTPCGQVGL